MFYLIHNRYSHVSGKSKDSSARSDNVQVSNEINTDEAAANGPETGRAETGGEGTEATGANSGEAASSTAAAGASAGGLEAGGTAAKEDVKADPTTEQELDKGKDTSEQEPTKAAADDTHADGTVSYLTYKVYISWLEEFSSNIEKYNSCLHKYRLILEDNKKNLNHVKAMRILSNWRTYLNESLQFEKYMTGYLKGKPITKCSKCGDYTLCDIPEDHELPVELKTAANACIRWKQLLLEAEILCKGLPAPKSHDPEAPTEPTEPSEPSMRLPDGGAPPDSDAST